MFKQLSTKELKEVYAARPWINKNALTNLFLSAFAEAVYNYQVLPDFLINLTAIILPWLELIIGIFLIIGLFNEGSVCIMTALLVIFFGAMVFNLARGLDIHCGCFSTSPDGTNNASMTWYVIRDGLFLLPAFYLFYQTFQGKKRMVMVKDL